MAKILQFLSPRFKGPFFLTTGSDGVDETFDVVSYRTGKVAASVRYWYESEQAYELATIIRIALNAHFCHIENPCRKMSDLLLKFRMEYPGPFELRFDPEPFDSYLIIDTKTKQIVHVEYGKPGSMQELFSRILVAAFNGLMSDHR